MFRKPSKRRKDRRPSNAARPPPELFDVPPSPPPMRPRTPRTPRGGLFEPAYEEPLPLPEGDPSIAAAISLAGHLGVVMRDEGVDSLLEVPASFDTYTSLKLILQEGKGLPDPYHNPLFDWDTHFDCDLRPKRPSKPEVLVVEILVDDPHSSSAVSIMCNVAYGYGPPPLHGANTVAHRLAPSRYKEATSSRWRYLLPAHNFLGGRLSFDLPVYTGVVMFMEFVSSAIVDHTEYTQSPKEGWDFLAFNFLHQLMWARRIAPKLIRGFGDEDVKDFFGRLRYYITWADTMWREKSKITKAYVRWWEGRHRPLTDEEYDDALDAASWVICETAELIDLGKEFLAPPSPPPQEPPHRSSSKAQRPSSSHARKPSVSKKSKARKKDDPPPASSRKYPPPAGAFKYFDTRGRQPDPYSSSSARQPVTEDLPTRPPEYVRPGSRQSWIHADGNAYAVPPPSQPPPYAHQNIRPPRVFVPAVDPMAHLSAGMANMHFGGGYGNPHAAAAHAQAQAAMAAAAQAQADAQAYNAYWSPRNGGGVPMMPNGPRPKRERRYSQW
ncbi:hypothetical protein JCM6882_003510 [Rhodosporidiobolus microsporus]